MGEIPPTRKSDLEKSAEAIRIEEAHWRRLGLDPNNTMHPPATIWHAKLQVRAVIRALVDNGVLDEEDLERIFNEEVLAAMKKIRAEQETQQIGVPRPMILDQFGRNFKL